VFRTLADRQLSAAGLPWSRSRGIIQHGDDERSPSGDRAEQAERRQRCISGGKPGGGIMSTNVISKAMGKPMVGPRCIGFSDRLGRPMGLEELKGRTPLGQFTAFNAYRSGPFGDDFDHAWKLSWGLRSHIWEPELLPRRVIVPVPVWRRDKLLGYVALSMWLTACPKLNIDIAGWMEYELQQQVERLWSKPLPPEPTAPEAELVDVGRDDFWSDAPHVPNFKLTPPPAVVVENWRAEHTRWLFHCLIDAWRHDASSEVIEGYFSSYSSVGFDNVAELPEGSRHYARQPSERNLWTAGMKAVRESEAWDRVREEGITIDMARWDARVYDPLPEPTEECPYPGGEE